MLRLLPLSLLLFVLAAASAQAQHVDRIEIIEWGIYRADRVGEAPTHPSAMGTSYVAKDIRLQHVTTTIPALLGTTFGFRFRVVGSSPGAKVSLKYVIRLPSQGVTNPAKGRTFFSSEYDSHAVVGDLKFQGYTLDYDWEVETGPWTLEIWHGGRKLGEKMFMVTRLVSAAE